MKLVFFGTPDFAVPPLTALLQSKWDVRAVVTQPDKQSGRGRKIHACPVKAQAERAGIPVLQPAHVKDKEFIAGLRAIAPDVIVVVAYGQILTKEILKLPPFGCINIHASLLPKYRGASPINSAIIHGDETTGITTMLMDEGMDTGHVLLQIETDIVPDENAGDLSNRLSHVGAEAIIKTLEDLEQGILKPVPQSGQASYAPIMKKADGLIDWSMSASALANFIRGMNPWPGAYTFLAGERMRIHESRVSEEAGEPGTVLRVSKDELIVGAGDRSIEILKLQPSGKKVMDTRAFLQGKKLDKGMKFDGE